MEKDCHYYVMYFMCLAAGMEIEDAYETAYCSEYVDDATDGRKKTLIDKDNNRYMFDPIRSAHNGLKSIGIDIQEKIYYPFHFLPGLKGDSFEEKMVTHPGKEGYLFQKVVDEALKSSNHFRIGVSLHALTDTYSHCNFSGMWSWSNDVSHLNYIPAGRNWFRNLFNKIGWHFKRGIFAAAPPIGHSNAFTFPDRPYLNWKYTDYLGELTLVTNNIKFVIGFLDLYESLIGPYAKKQGKSPRLGDTHDRTNDELRQKLWEGVNFHGSLKKRCRNWQAIILKFAKEQGLTIPDNHLHYDEKEWENNVYKSIDVKKKKLKVSIEEFEKSPLYRFHEAGRAHRVFVLSIVNDPSALGVRALEGEVMISNEIIHKTREKKLLKKI